MITKLDAIRSLYDGPITSQANGDIIYHGNNNEPTEEAIEVKLKELEAEYEKQAYARARSSQYPSIIDVVVALAEKEEGNDSMWKEITGKRAKVKADNPKP